MKIIGLAAAAATCLLLLASKDDIRRLHQMRSM